jgi:hypothetical protein
VPVGAYGQTLPGGRLRLASHVTSLDGRQRVAGELTGPVGEPERLGAALAAELIGQGAHLILDQVRALSQPGDLADDPHGSVDDGRRRSGALEHGEQLH